MATLQETRERIDEIIDDVSRFARRCREASARGPVSGPSDRLKEQTATRRAPAATMADLQAQARRELAFASELTPQYRGFLGSLLPDYATGDRKSAATFGRPAGGSRLFEAEPEATQSRPGDWAFGNGDDPVFGQGPSPALEPQRVYSYSRRLQEATAAQGPDPTYDSFFAPAGNLS